MTTQEAQKPRTKTFQTKGITVATVDKDGNVLDRPILVIPKGAIPRHGTYPVRLSVDKAIADTIKPDVLYYVKIEQGREKKPDPKWDSTDYFWNIIYIGVNPPPVVVPPPAAMPTAAPPVGQSATSGPGQAAEVAPWPDGTSGPTPAPPNAPDKRTVQVDNRNPEFRTPAQIMRCVALEGAVAEICSRRSTGAFAESDLNVLALAIEWAKYLETGNVQGGKE